MTQSNMTCEAMTRLLAQYVAGTLDNATNVRLEAHASLCSACEARLELVTSAAANNAANALRSRGDHAAVPGGVRDRVLRHVASDHRKVERPELVGTTADRSRRGLASSRRLWSGGLLTFAAAAALFVAVRREPAASPSPAAVAGRDALVARIADEGARSEFVELDVATRELEAELAKTPADRDLRAYLSSVRARRDELERRVKDATL